MFALAPLHVRRITNECDRAGSALRIYDLSQQYPFLTSNQLAQKTGLSAPTVNAALADLDKMGTVEEISGHKRGCVQLPALSCDPQRGNRSTARR